MEQVKGQANEGRGVGPFPGLKEHRPQPLGIQGAGGIQGLFHREVAVELGIRKLGEAHPHRRGALGKDPGAAVHHRQGALKGDPLAPAGEELAPSLSQRTGLAQEVLTIVGNLVAANHQRGGRTGPAGCHGLGLRQGEALGPLGGAFPRDGGFIHRAVASFEGGAEAFEDLRTVRGSGGQHENREHDANS